MLDLEDLDDSVSLTDFSLDEFRLDLLRFLESRRAELEEADAGLYAVVPPAVNLPACRPGDLFCLRQRMGDGSPNASSEALAQPLPGDSAQINPLAPHYLVYVHDDGAVRFSFAQPKEFLLLLRKLAAGEASAHEKLCDLFDQRTSEGADMRHYDGLIRQALASIERTFQRRAAMGLLAGRGSLLPTADEALTADQGQFELVTWLVILAPE